MASPIPGVPVATPYAKRGTSWSCSKDSSGRGLHTGVDFPAPAGTPILAPIAGQIRHRSYGAAFGNHQFAISPDNDQPFGAGEVFFAHCRTRLPDGAYVQVGDVIAEVGAEGNVTGPHLHMEFMPSTKNTWRCGIHADPQPIIDYQPPEPPSIETGFGLWKWYSGKPASSMTVYPDGQWHRITGVNEPASGIKGGSEQRFLYLRLEFTRTRTAARVVETRFVRADGDATAYDSEEFGTLKDSYPYQNQHMEDGNGGGGKWYVKVTGGKDPMTITTRYAKQHAVYEV